MRAFRAQERMAVASTELKHAEQARSAAADRRIPLVFGVTGHRDLDFQQIPNLEERVQEFFKEFRKRCPNTPQILLSPLAEGADRLVARVALRDGIGARLMAPLPMRPDFYEEDFGSPESIGEFREFLKGAVHFQVPHSPGDHHVSQSGAGRNAQYRAVGEFIARYSQVVVALWDGEKSRGEGGTAEIVELQRTGVPQREAPRIEPPEGFPVYWIPTLHAASNKTLGTTAPVWLYADLFEDNKERAQAYYDTIFKRIDDFNRYVSRDSEAFREQVKRSKSYVLADDEIESLYEEERLVLERYAASDALAITFQKYAKWLILALHLLIFCSFALFVLFAHFPRDWMDSSPKWWGFLIPCCAGLVLGSLLLLANWFFRIHTNYQDFRAMAEGLRVALFWKLAGISDSVAGHYLWSQRSELDWIRSAIRGWMLPPSARIPEEHHERRIRLVLRRWVEDQQKYFEKQEKRNENSAQWKERLATALIVGALLAGLALTVTAKRWPDAEVPQGIELIIVEFALALGALVHNYNEKMAFARHAKQYRRMQPIFKYAGGLIQEAIERGETAQARELLHQLGEQALTENGDWVVIHRERPVEVPHP